MTINREYPQFEIQPPVRTGVTPPLMSTGEKEKDVVSEWEADTARIPEGYTPPKLSNPTRQATLELNAYDKDLAVSGKKQQVGPYEVSGMTSEELARFSRQPTRPGTRMMSTGRPAGGWSTQGGGGQPEFKEIAPPRSVGDIQRYKREVTERDKRMGFAQKTGEMAESQRRGDIAQMKAGSDIEQQQFERGVATEGFESKREQQGKLLALQEEFRNPDTTPQRRRQIERESSLLRGDKPMRPQVLKRDTEFNGTEEISTDPWTGLPLNRGQQSVPPVSARVKGKTMTTTRDGRKMVWDGDSWTPAEK